MRRLFTILFSATMFVSLSFGQMVVKGDVVNVGNLRSDVPAIVKAAADVAGISGKIENKGVLNLKNGITFVSNDESDGQLFNDYKIGTFDPEGQVNFIGSTDQHKKVQVVKTFTRGRRYYISFPFDVKVSDITVVEKTSNVLEDDSYFKPGKFGDNRYTSIYAYNSQERANTGLTPGVDPGWEHVTYATEVLNAGEGYQLLIIKDDEVTDVEKITLNFPAASEATLANIYPSGGTQNLSYKFYKGTSTSELQWGWDLLGIHQTSNYALHQDYWKLTLEGLVERLNGKGLDYIYLNTGDGTNWIPVVIDDLAQHISPYAAYFVQTGGERDEAIQIENGEEGVLALTTTGLTQNALRYQSDEVHRTSKNSANRLNLKLEGETGYSDELLIRQSDHYSNNYALGEDAPKMYSESIPNFYSFVKDIPMSLNRIKTTDKDLPLGMSLKKADSYTISISRLEGFEDTDIYLIDKTAGIRHNLLDGDYTFQAENGARDDRFALHFGSVTAINTPNSQINVFVENNVAHVKNIKVGDTVSIYNIGGQLISQGVASSSEQSYRLAGTGVYIVKVSGSESFISKVINK